MKRRSPLARPRNAPPEGISRVSHLVGLALTAGTLSRKKGGKRREERLCRLVTKMATLRGLPQKIGQVLSINELEADEPPFTSLVSHAARLSKREFMELVKAELKRPIELVFQHISDSGHGASLGETRYCKLRDGEEVAVKVQYPGMAETLELDLRALGLLAQPLGRTRGLPVDDYRFFLRESLLDELDYTKEAGALDRFYRHVEELEGFSVPRPFLEYSTRRLLVMEWITGGPFPVTRGWTKSQRERVGRLLLQFFLRSCLVWGEIHGDPHPGNYLFHLQQGEVRIGLFDFGCVKRLSPKERLALRTLVTTTTETTNDTLLKTLSALGFREELLEPMKHRLPSAMAVLLTPFRTCGLFTIEEWKLSERMSSALGEYRWNFRIAGPPSLLAFIRAFSGLVAYLKALRVSLDWAAELEEALSSPSAQGQEERIHSALLCARQTHPAASESKQLRIRVRRNGETRVDLFFPIRAVENIPELIPDDVRLELEAKSFDLQAVVSRVIDSAYPKGDIFMQSEAGREVRVWLE